LNRPLSVAGELPEDHRQMLQTGARAQRELSPDAAQAPQKQASFAGKSVESLRLLWVKRQLLLRLTAAGLIAGTLLAFLLPKQYESSTQLMPPDDQSRPGELLAALSARTGNGLGGVAGDLLGVQSSGDLFIGILRSRTVQDRLIERFNLRPAYGVKLEEDARRKLAQRTGLSEDRKSGIITISFSDRDPHRAAAIAQAYVEELDRLVAELSTSAAHRERVFLEERLQAVKQDLDRASRDFGQFASKNTAIDIKEQGRAMVEAAATLQGQMIAAEAELRGLEQIYTPDNVRVRSVRARIAELRLQLDRMGGDKPQEAEATLPANAKDTDGDENSPYPSIRSLPILGVTYSDLLRRTKIQETVYETLTQEYELAKVQEARETPSVKVLDPASVPERKSFPPRLLIILWSTCFAFGAGAFWALAQGRWEQTDPANPGKALAQEVLDSVNAKMPWSTPNGSRSQAVMHEVWTRLAGSRSGPHRGTDPGDGSADRYGSEESNGSE